MALDSILLAEADTLYIGHPRPPAIDPLDGSFYISDTFSKRVLRFGRSGTLTQVYGRPGGGPGEFQFNGLVFVLDDSTVVVADETKQRFNLFDRASARYRGERVFYRDAETVAGLTPPVHIGDDLWFASLDPVRRLALARWNLADDTIVRIGVVPRDYHASRDGTRGSFANAMFGGSLAAARGALVRGWEPMNTLVRHAPDGSIIDSLPIPAVRRKGVPEDLQEIYDIDQLGLSVQRLTISSRLKLLHTLPDSGLALIHHDQEILSLDGPLPVMAAHVWLGVLTPDLERACVDTPVPVSLDAMPAEAFRGDTLFVLDRRITDDARLETWIKLYRIDTERCDWIPLRK